MLLRFSVENVFSFGGRSTLDLKAVDGKTPLRVVGIYGANASGKSNLLLAFNRFQGYVMHSHDRSWMADFNGVPPFLGNGILGGVAKPCIMEVEFELKREILRYGFAFQDGVILKEWLFSRKNTKSHDKDEVRFLRKSDRKTATVQTGKGFEKLTRNEVELLRPDALFLTLAGNYNVAYAMAVSDEITQRMSVCTALSEDAVRTSEKLYEHSRLASRIVDFIRQTDPFIRDIVVRGEADDSELTGKRKVRLSVKVVPSFSNRRKGRRMEFDFTRLASVGTRKAYELAGPIFEALDRGETLFVDEFGSAMHPLLSESIIRLFIDPESNSHGAQLVFVTHDAGLLELKETGPDGIKRNLLGDDQIYFVERNRELSSELYPLSDFKKGRKGDSRRMKYLDGEFGAIPYFKSTFGRRVRRGK